MLLRLSMNAISRKWCVVAAFSIMAAVSSKAAQALPVMETLGAPAAFPFEAILPDAAVDFTSIIALSNCSASLARLETSLPDDQALVMTNGHCKEGGFINAGE